MVRIALILLLGFAAGYAYGFKDAQTNDENVITRAVERVGGSNRGKYRTDVDATMRSVENP